MVMLACNLSVHTFTSLREGGGWLNQQKRPGKPGLLRQFEVGAYGEEPARPAAVGLLGRLGELWSSLSCLFVLLYLK